MLFHVRMDVSMPPDMPADVANEIKSREKAYSQELQRSGKWRHIWRIAGAYANYSIFDVQSNAELHDILLGLPLFPYMKISVTPLCRHPSSVRDGDEVRSSERFENSPNTSGDRNHERQGVCNSGSAGPA